MSATIVRKNRVILFALALLGAFSISGELRAHGSLGHPTKGYLDELEEAYVAKIARGRAERRLRSGRTSISSLGSNINFSSLKKGGKQIGEDVTASIKSTLKDPLLNLLASSELISWADLKERVAKAKKALELFSVKYKSEFEKADTDKSEDDDEDDEDEDDEEEEDEEEAPKKTSMPGMPGVKIKPKLKKAIMPGLKKAPGMPGVKKVMTVKKPGMPGAVKKVPGMPGVKKVAPGQKPAGMPMG